ncbi:MAG: hypothetical protein ABL904_04670 [Hyphomicrobiaceae bacterium]
MIGFPDKQSLSQSLCTALLPVSILIPVCLNTGLARLLNRAACEAHRVTAPSTLDGPSKFFEFAVAAVINLFGYEPDSAQATVVGVLVEVSVMLSVDEMRVSAITVMLSALPLIGGSHCRNPRAISAQRQLSH